MSSTVDGLASITRCRASILTHIRTCQMRAVNARRIDTNKIPGCWTEPFPAPLQQTPLRPVLRSQCHRTRHATVFDGACTCRRKCLFDTGNFGLHSIAKDLCFTARFWACPAIAVRPERVHSEEVGHVRDVSRNPCLLAAPAFQLPTIPFFSSSRPPPRCRSSVYSISNSHFTINTHTQPILFSLWDRGSLSLLRSTF